jgi:superfamily I DNA/RNA helicase
MKLSETQLKILNDKNPRVVVVASAASGKTRLLTEKVRQVLRDGADPSKVAVITFTNLAAEELRQRLGDDYKEGMFMGTIHSLANYFLLSNGIDTNKYLKSERFNELFSLVNKNQECIGEIDFLLLDEAQDSSKLQFEFIFDMIKPKSFFVVGDPKQSIYGWNGGDPRLLIDLGRTEGVSVHSLNQNYRNAQNILLFAKDIISKTGLIDDSIPMRNSMGESLSTRAKFEFNCQDNKTKRGFW